VEEDAGRTETAIGFYTRALAAWPQSQVARIAIANLQDRLDHPQAASDIVVSFFGPRIRPTLDPWSEYSAGQSVEGLKTLEDLRYAVMATTRTKH